MSAWQGCAGCGNLIPVGGYEWCGGCRPEEQDDGGAAYWRERFEDMAARYARLGEQYDAHMTAVRPALARAWDEGARQGSRGVLPAAELERRNPYRDELPSEARSGLDVALSDASEVRAFVTPFEDDGFCACHPDQMGRTQDCGVALHRDRAAYWRLHVDTEPRCDGAALCGCDDTDA